MERDGLALYPEWLSAEAQLKAVEAVGEILAGAALYRPRMPGSGAPFSVRMSCAGPLGWVSDEKGYRYQRKHPVSGEVWPDIPQLFLKLWEGVSGCLVPPECCLVNVYGEGARMGLHQDRDEEAMEVAVVSLSLGDTAVFRVKMEGERASRSMRLRSGDVVVLGGLARRAFHGIDRILFGSSSLLPGGGRINVTLRRVTAVP